MGVSHLFACTNPSGLMLRCSTGAADAAPAPAAWSAGATVAAGTAAGSAGHALAADAPKTLNTQWTRLATYSPTQWTRLASLNFSAFKVANTTWPGINLAASIVKAKCGLAKRSKASYKATGDSFSGRQCRRGALSTGAIDPSSRVTISCTPSVSLAAALRLIFFPSRYTFDFSVREYSIFSQSLHHPLFVVSDVGGDAICNFYISTFAGGGRGGRGGHLLHFPKGHLLHFSLWCGRCAKKPVNTTKCMNIYILTYITRIYTHTCTYAYTHIFMHIQRFFALLRGYWDASRMLLLPESNHSCLFASVARLRSYWGIKNVMGVVG